MNRRVLIAGAATIGPLAAWLMWAILNRRWGHAIAAGAANTLLWSIGPTLLVMMEKHL